MKKIFSLIMAFLLVFTPVVLAEETAETVEAGVTPDSPVYGLERAMERISMALTFGKAAKAKKGLMHARERLAEVRAMIEAKKLDKAQKAQKIHERIMEDVEENINEISEDPEEELESEVDVEKEIIQLDEDLAELDEDVNTAIETLTEGERIEVTETFEAIEERTQKVRERIKEKREKTKIKLKTKAGMTDEEVEDLEREVEKEANLEQLRQRVIQKNSERLQRKITKMRNLATQAAEKGKDVSALEARLDDASGLLNQIKASEGTTAEIKEAVQEINQLLNFRGVYNALQSKDIEARLANIDAKAEAAKIRVEARIEEARTVRTMVAEEDEESKTTSSEQTQSRKGN